MASYARAKGSSLMGEDQMRQVRSLEMQKSLEETKLASDRKSLADNQKHLALLTGTYDSDVRIKMEDVNAKIASLNKSIAEQTENDNRYRKELVQIDRELLRPNNKNKKELIVRKSVILVKLKEIERSIEDNEEALMTLLNGGKLDSICSVREGINRTEGNILHFEEEIGRLEASLKEKEAGIETLRREKTV